MNSMLVWKFRQLPQLKMSQDVRESVTEALERMLRRSTDATKDFQNVEESVEAEHCTVEEIVITDRVDVAHVFPQEGQEQMVQVVKSNSARTHSSTDAGAGTECGLPRASGYAGNRGCGAIHTTGQNV